MLHINPFQIDQDSPLGDYSTRLDPHRRLCAAVLVRSLLDIQEPVTLRIWENRFIINNAINFFECRHTDPEDKFSYIQICAYLDLDPSLIFKYAGVKEKIDNLKKLLLLPPPEYRLVIREEASEEEKQKIRQLRREQRIRAKEQELLELQAIHKLNLGQK